uniref:MFS domain-containing protein n=1 Tax=Caenorhabditis tropicalis TaxID=1561998 RepID=A0A1I7V4A4_9PELO
MMTTKLEDGVPEKQHHPFLHIRSRRLHVVLMLMYAFFCMCQMTAHIGLSLSCMCNSTAVAMMNSNKSEGASSALLMAIYDNKSSEILENGEASCTKLEGKVIKDYGGTFIWSVSWQGYIVSAAFLGGFIFSYPAGFLVDRFSARHILSAAILILTVSSILMPFLATVFGEQGAFVSRFFMGISETMLIPALNSMVTKWIPVNEKSLAASVFTAGNQLSGMFGNVLVAELCASSLGWSSIFYSGSLFGISWLFLWHLTVRNSPHNTRWIHKRELDYLANHIPPKHTSTGSRNKKTPWRDMMTSKVFWSLMYNSIIGNMMIALIFVYIPVYFKDVLMLDVQANGFYSAIPHVSNLVTKLIWGYIMDKLRRNKVLSPTATVKLSQFASMIGISASCFCLRYMNCSTPYQALILLSVVSGFFGLSISGFYTSLLSVAPSHIGTLTSFGTVIGFIGRMFTPLMISYYKTVGTAEEWGSILLIYVFATASGGIVFALFASGEVQDWDYSKRHNTARPNALVAPESEKNLEEY